MNVQEAKRKVQLREWADQINECRQSGLTVKEWCTVNGVYLKTYYNRMKRVREEILNAMENDDKSQLPVLVGRQPRKQLEKPTFAALPAPKRTGAAITVHIGAHIAEIQNNADAETIDSVLRTLTRL